jgi:hypothetical protein
MGLYQIFKAGLRTVVVVQAVSLVAEPNEISQQIQPRQHAAVDETSRFLRRAKHACEFNLEAYSCPNSEADG